MSIPYFDAHCDTVVEAGLKNEGLRRNSLHIDFERLRAYSPCAQVFSVCTGFRDDTEETQYYVNLLCREIEANSDIVTLCLSSADLDRAVNEGKIAAFLSIEGAEQIGSLEKAYADGVRIVHPTWNFDNALCGAAMGNGSGLTEAGREFVKTAQKMGILLDMSHISEAAFWDVLELTEKPVIAGHSDSNAVHPGPRSLTDEQFKALVQIGGGAGINLYPGFLGLTRDIDAIIAHIEHYLSLGGEKAVFLGCDFDGIDITPKGITDVRDMEKLYEALLRRNHPESLVRAIFWSNLCQIIGRAL